MTVMVEQEDDPRSGRWAGYAACACAFLSAAFSFCWGVGGTFALDTVGAEAVELVQSGHPGILIALWCVGIVKVAAGLLALALVRPWGWHLSRRSLLPLAGWGGAMVLVLYGGAQIGAQLLVITGVSKVPEEMDWRGFYGHLYLWNPWFVVWGGLLGRTAFYYTRNQRRRLARRRVASSVSGGRNG